MRIPWDLDRGRFIIVLCCFGCSLLQTFLIVMISTNIGTIQKTFDVDYSLSMWYSQIVSLVFISCFLISVAIADKFGKRRTLITGLALVGISSLLSAFASNMAMLFAFRIVTGFGVCLMQTSSTSIIVDNVCKDRLGDVMAMNYSCSCIGAIVAPLISYYIGSSIGLGLLFLIPLPFCVIFIFALRKTENVISKPDTRPNYLQHSLYLASSVLIIFAVFATAFEYRLALAIVGLILFALLIYVYKHSSQHMISFRSFKTKGFTLSFAIAMIYYIGIGATGNTMNNIFQLLDQEIMVFGILVSTSALAAFMTSFKPFIQTVTSPLIAKYGKRYKKSTLIAAGFILALASTVMCLIASYNPKLIPPFLLITVMCVLLALAGSTFVPHNRTVMLDSVPKEERNAASSFTTITATLGNFIAMSVMLNMLNGSTTVESFNNAAHVVLTMACIIGVIGLVIMYRRNHSMNEA